MQEKRTNPWILEDKYRVLFHLLFWAYIFIGDIFWMVGLTEPPEDPRVDVVIILIDVLIVYFNLYFLIPRYLLKRKYFLYILLTLFTIILDSVISLGLTYPWELMGTEKEWPIYIEFFGPFSATVEMVVLAMTIKLLKFFAKNQSTITNLETTNLKTELTYLKNQINPHFLFNALNNIYVQTRKHPKDAPESVMLLSELLRYQLYDCAKDKVYLRNELEYIKNYIALEKMRRTDAAINLEINGHSNGIMIAPFLFIPFIENAVKHGLETQKDAFVNIKFNISNNTLLFQVSNPKPEVPPLKKDGGIGLINIKRRLALLYKNTHQLTLADTPTKYEVVLRLDIESTNLLDSKTEHGIS